VSNEAGNVVGLMPHPERAMSTLLGSADGRVLLEGFLGLGVGAGVGRGEGVGAQ